MGNFTVLNNLIIEFCSQHQVDPMPSLYQGGMQTLIVQLNLSVPLDLTEVVAIMFNGKNRDETSLSFKVIVSLASWVRLRHNIFMRVSRFLATGASWVFHVIVHLLKILDGLCHCKFYEKVRNRLQLRTVAEVLACLHNSSCGWVQYWLRILGKKSNIDRK